MERVAFLVEETNARLGCMLNPESLTFRRQSGIKLVSQSRPALTAPGQVAQSALSSGGGHTELELDLVFDVSLGLGSSIASRDVRDHTRPIWALSEPRHAVSGGDLRGPERQPYLRFVWGKSWNLRAVVLNVAERLEEFDSMGRPGRSWMRLRLLVVDAPPPAARALAPGLQAVAGIAEVDLEPRIGAESRSHVTARAPDSRTDTSADRIDDLAQRYFHDPNLWRLIAKANGLTRPDQIVPGQRLVIPDPPQRT